MQFTDEVKRMEITDTFVRRKLNVFAQTKTKFKGKGECYFGVASRRKLKVEGGKDR